MTAARTPRHRPNKAILDDLAVLLTEAFNDGRIWIQPPPGHHRDEAYLPADLVRRTTDRLREALAAGLVAGQIVLASRLPWTWVLSWIGHFGTVADRVAAHRAHVHYLELSLSSARLAQAGLARELVDGVEGLPSRNPRARKPMTKIEAAAALGVSRPTLDDWLAKAEAAGRS